MFFEIKRIRTSEKYLIQVYQEQDGELVTTDTISIHFSKDRIRFVETLVKQSHFSAELVRSEFENAYKAFVVNEGHPQSQPAPPEYEIRSNRFVFGGTDQAICNFTAEILEEIVCDDGEETTHWFRIAGTHEDGTTFPTILITIADFLRMDWAIVKWGASAIIMAGPRNKDHLRAAIQHLSPAPLSRKIYAHSGWVVNEGEQIYLHAGGAIGAVGLLSSIETKLPQQLSGLKLPAPPTGSELIAAINTSFSLLGLGPRSITVPLLASIFRAPLGCNIDFSVFFIGRTGSQKSELAALAQQHFGPTMNRQNLPANFSSTANATEVLAFTAKDVVLAVDDFVPSGSFDQQRTYQHQAQRLFRSQGNGSGRQRLRQDETIRPEKSPRGLLLANGEVHPTMNSVAARLISIAIQPGDINLGLLTLAQEAARNGTFAACMAGYIQWLAPRYERIQANFQTSLDAMSPQFRFPGLHDRAPCNIASLMIGLHYFLEFAVEKGALSKDLSDNHWTDFKRVAREIALAQIEEQFESDPAMRFMEILNELFTLKNAHLEGVHGDIPDRSWELGWAYPSNCRLPVKAGNSKLLGWADSQFMYLIVHEAVAVVSRAGASHGEPITITPRVLAKELVRLGLAIREPSQDGNLFRLRIGKFSNRSKPPRVLRILRPESVNLTRAPEGEPPAAHRSASPISVARHTQPVRPPRG